MRTNNTIHENHVIDYHAQYLRRALALGWNIRTHSVRWVNRSIDNLAECNVADLAAVEDALRGSPYTVTEVRNTRASLGLAR